jgi:IS30 family transposase
MIQQRVAIEERPQHIADRIEAGHWEADLISFRQNTQYILVLHERKTRYTATIKLQNKTAEHTFQQIAAYCGDRERSMRTS